MLVPGGKGQAPGTRGGEWAETLDRGAHLSESSLALTISQKERGVNGQHSPRMHTEKNTGPHSGNTAGFFSAAPQTDGVDVQQYPSAPARRRPPVFRHPWSTTWVDVKTYPGGPAQGPRPAHPRREHIDPGPGRDWFRQWPATQNGHSGGAYPLPLNG